jgi:hypothetical protein
MDLTFPHLSIEAYMFMYNSSLNRTPTSGLELMLDIMAMVKAMGPMGIPSLRLWSWSLCWLSKLSTATSSAATAAATGEFFWYSIVLSLYSVPICH